MRVKIDEGWADITVGSSLARHMANLGSVPSTPQGPLSPVWSDRLAQS